jgi:adenylosuccinate synthase
LNDAFNAGHRVLFEGAQGLMLDIDHGMYPFGTSSNTVAGAVCTGAGIGPTKVDEVLGVVKAYTSRVGAGPVPTELTDELGSKLQEKGREFGTVTGRRRRCGWIDAIPLRLAARVNGLTCVALTKMDTLAGFNPVKICVEYRADGRTLTEQPAGLREFSSCKPVYEEMEGWPDLSPAEWAAIARRGYDELPRQARRYVERIEEIMKVKVKIVSIGEGREATIHRTEAWPTN